MHQDQLDGLVTFIAVSEERSFSAAAVRLGVSPSAVSQSIRSLEQRLGLTLFNRTTRSVSLTEIGQRYLERICPAVGELVAASQDALNLASRPGGLLRLNVLRAGFMIVLQPLLREFLDLHPDINIEMVIESSLVDIVDRGFDAGIRFGDLVEQDMIALKVGPDISAYIVASPDYLGQRGAPSHPRDLMDHDCIVFRHLTTGQVERWQFEKDEESFELNVPGRVILNDAGALVQAALDGVGIAYTINGYIEGLIASGRLVRVLADWSPRLAGLSLYYPHRRVPAKLRALIEFIRQRENVRHATIDGFIK